MKKTATPDELKRYTNPGPSQDEKPEEVSAGAVEENPDPVY